MGSFIMAWAVGQAIIIYRAIRDQGGPPWPGQMLAATGLFAAMAILAEAGPGARRTALLLTWGLDLAAFMNIYNVSYLPGTKVERAKDGTSWWAKVAIAPAAGGTTWLLPGGGCKDAGAIQGAAGAALNPPILQQAQ